MLELQRLPESDQKQDVLIFIGVRHVLGELEHWGLKIGEYWLDIEGYERGIRNTLKYHTNDNEYEFKRIYKKVNPPKYVSTIRLIANLNIVNK